MSIVVKVTSLFNSHCIATTHQLLVILKYQPGRGYEPLFCLYNFKAVLISHILALRSTSLVQEI
ncbi:hypothetical protein HOG21_01345 [bacterium]|nr:hypothetical protein [bacterium]